MTDHPPREVGFCADCGFAKYQFFDRATYTWSESARHLPNENCMQNLRRVIDGLNKRLSQLDGATELRPPA